MSIVIRNRGRYLDAICRNGNKRVAFRATNAGGLAKKLIAARETLKERRA